MGCPSAFVIVLTSADRAVLERRARAARTEHRDRVRARIVLAAADAVSNAAIAANLDVHVDTVRKWRKRFAANGMAGLSDLWRVLEISLCLCGTIGVWRIGLHLRCRCVVGIGSGWRR